MNANIDLRAWLFIESSVTRALNNSDDLPPYTLSFRPAETEAEAFANWVFAVPEALRRRFIDYRHWYCGRCIARSEKPASQQMYAEGARII
jgi:hypothetical protein